MIEALEKMKTYMAERDGSARGSLEPIVNTYLTSVLLPSTQGSMGVRNERELRTLALALDHVLAGRFANAMDVLVQRFKAVESSSSEGGWAHSRHLELLPEGRVTAISPQEREAMIRQENSDSRVRHLARGERTR